LSSEIYKWAQRYSFTELSGAIRATRQRDRKARAAFLAALLLPPLTIFTLTVLLPLMDDPLAEYYAQAAPTREEMVVLASHRTVNGRTPPGEQGDDLLPRMNALGIEHAFLQARAQMAASDSIALAIDLSDSTACIEMAGVPVRRCKIAGIKMSGRLQRLRQHRAVAAWLATPFALSKATASLPKIPLRVLEAPRDTAEAKSRNDEVIAVEKGDVFFNLRFNKHLSLSVWQTQRTSAAGWPRRLSYILRRGWWSARDDLHTLAQLKLPTSRLHIRLEMSREDATAIYRALPVNAELALRF
jgi:hypothetical protein